MKITSYTRLNASKKVTAADAKLVSALKNVASSFHPLVDDDAQLYFAGAVDLACLVLGFQKTGEALAELLLSAGINNGIKDFNESEDVDFDAYCKDLMDVYRESFKGLSVKKELNIYLAGLDVFLNQSKERIIFEILYNSYK